MLSRDPPSGKKRARWKRKHPGSSTPRVHKHRALKKRGIAVFEFEFDLVSVEYKLERLGLLLPNVEHDKARLQKLLAEVFNDWLAE